MAYLLLRTVDQWGQHFTILEWFFIASWKEKSSSFVIIDQLYLLLYPVSQDKKGTIIGRWIGAASCTKYCELLSKNNDDIWIKYML